MRRAKGWSVPRCRSGVASTAKPLPLPSISSVDWQQASPRRLTPRAESFRGEGPCVVLSMISRSASPRRGDSGSMLLRTQPCGGGVGSYLGSSDAGRAAQPSRARSLGGVVRLPLFSSTAAALGTPALCVEPGARRGNSVVEGELGRYPRNARTVLARARPRRRRSRRADGSWGPFGALRDARRPGRHTPEYMHYSEHRHANQAMKNN